MRNTSISLCFTARDLYAAISVCDPNTPLPVPLEVMTVIEGGKTLKLTIVESDYKPSPSAAAMMRPPAPGEASNQRVQPAGTEPAEQAGRGPLGCDGLLGADGRSEDSQK